MEHGQVSMYILIFVVFFSTSYCSWNLAYSDYQPVLNGFYYNVSFAPANIELYLVYNAQSLTQLCYYPSSSSGLYYQVSCSERLNTGETLYTPLKFSVSTSSGFIDLICSDQYSPTICPFTQGRAYITYPDSTFTLQICNNVYPTTQQFCYWRNPVDQQRCSDTLLSSLLWWRSIYEPTTIIKTDLSPFQITSNLGAFKLYSPSYSADIVQSKFYFNNIYSTLLIPFSTTLLGYQTDGLLYYDITEFCVNPSTYIVNSFFQSESVQQGSFQLGNFCNVKRITKLIIGSGKWNLKVQFSFFVTAAGPVQWNMFLRKDSTVFNIQGPPMYISSAYRHFTYYPLELTLITPGGEYWLYIETFSAVTFDHNDYLNFILFK